MSVQVQVERLPIRIEPDPRHVLSRFFPADEQQTRRRISRVIALSEDDTERILSQLVEQYTGEHYDITAVWQENFHRVESMLPENCPSLSQARQQLIGAYFTMDYAVEAVALFNPSIVEAIDQSGMSPGSTRFGMSLRAVGEGHVSSIVMRNGVIDADNNITLDRPSATRRALVEEVNPEFQTALIRRTLQNLGALGNLEELVLDRSGEMVSLAEVYSELERVREEVSSPAQWQQARDNLVSLMESNYRLKIPEGAGLSELVIFPVSQNESRGIEDLRLVKFTEDSGNVTICGTYTAFNGYTIFPTMLVVRGNGSVQSHTMSGRHAQNKGMALFPRKINGKFVMSGRLDGENLYIMESDNPLVWNEGRISQKPKYWWQFSVIGNCGSPIETKDGWLMLTHGVGPMRQYSIGAVLLDLEDPTRIIGELEEPLISPSEDERVGYVPNVVYTCGAMVHNSSLIIPYAVSDVVTKFARVDLEELLSALRSHG
ncbi:MAG: glycoside hydrolase family 130 protein [Armatimonadota bacterium]